MVWAKGERSGSYTVGPQSVGHELASKGLAAGGNTCTATDVAAVLGKMQFGDRDLARAGAIPKSSQETKSQIKWSVGHESTCA